MSIYILLFFLDFRQFECFFITKWRKNVSRIEFVFEIKASRYNFFQNSTRSDENESKCTMGNNYL